MKAPYGFCPIIKTNSCRNMWRNVVHLALADATDQRKSNALHQSEALIWIERGGKDFFMVCDMADYSPKYVRDKLALLLHKRSLVGKRHALNQILKTQGDF